MTHVNCSQQHNPCNCHNMLRRRCGMTRGRCEMSLWSSFQPVMCFGKRLCCWGMSRRETHLALPLCACAHACVCQCVSLCVSIDARRVESGDGAVARRYASRRSAVSVLPQEAGKSRREKIWHRLIQLIRFHRAAVGVTVTQRPE